MALTARAEQVQAALRRLGCEREVMELTVRTHTAAEAARALACELGQIAKSLVFVTVRERRPLIVIASGSNRVNEARIAHLVGEPIEIADPAYVAQVTGYEVGGVPPIAHATPMPVYIDCDLLEHQEIWAAAGTASAQVKLTPDELIRITGGTVVAVT